MRLFPAMHEIYADLSEWGPPRLTGTGSCIFLAFDEKNQADRATKALKCRYNVRAVRGVDHSPLLAKLSGES
jgi:4-diphosphocytidyl-2-C-methyl-D-erythritol kinase